MADGNVTRPADIEEIEETEESPVRLFGEAWYQERWAETSTSPFPRESLAKAECLLDAALGVADVLLADIDRVDHNEENSWPKFDTMSSRNRNGLGMALRFLLGEASMQIAKSRDD